MIKHSFSLALLIMLAICCGQTEASIQVQVTYTADNIIGGFFQNGGAPVEITPLGGNAGNWQQADTATLDLDWGHSYQLIFRVANTGTPRAGNPAGFLAQVTGGVVGGPIYTSTSWDVAVDDGGSVPTNFDTELSWTAATEYGDNGSTTIWYNAISGPISGISTSAAWLWDDNNFADLDHPNLWIRATFDTVVPEPTTLIVWSLLGLIGTGVWWRRASV